VILMVCFPPSEMLGRRDAPLQRGACRAQVPDRPAAATSETG
jgi:hypothetical protein